jgi:hypothetical protein
MSMRNGWSTRAKKTAVGASVVLGSFGIGGAGIALLDGGTASAATTPSTPSTAPTAGAKGHDLRKFVRRHTVDATITVKTKNGYETFDLARGTVGSISTGSITVDSPNGTTLTATITAQTKFHNTTATELATGDKVGVLSYEGVAKWVNTPKTTTSTPSS